MYEQFFNLNKKPFEMVPNPDFLYLSGSHKRALTYITHGVSEQAGFILLVGEVGSGKTTIVREFIKELSKNIILSKVFNTRVNSEQLISMINEDFGLDSTGKNKVLLLKDLYNFLIEKYEQGRQAILIIDEAQNLSTELLEEIRMLSNLETDYTKLIQIILVGQPELERTLSLPELRQLRQRISITCRIYPLDREETEEYIHHRLEVAGNREAVAFSREALDTVYQASKGIPRLINKVCDFVMLTSFTEQTREVDAAMVHDIVQELELEQHHVVVQSEPAAAAKRALLNALKTTPDHHRQQGPGNGEPAWHGASHGGEKEIASILKEIQRLSFLQRHMRSVLSSAASHLWSGRA
jgi:putative secretion ATPase (PEP-CTERM system associated)